MRIRTLALAAAALLTGAASAQDWLDNFNDGSATDGVPVTWNETLAFGAAFEVIDGDMVITIDPGTPAISSARVGAYFPSGASVRARMAPGNGPGRYGVAFADEPTGIQGYVAAFSTCQGGRIELFRGDELGAIIYLGGGPVLWSSSPMDGEFYIQMDVFDGVVSARVWRPGEAFPEAQIIADDATYPDGVASLPIQDFGTGASCGGVGGNDTFAVVRYAQASSTPLTHSGGADLNADGANDFSDVLDFLTAFAGAQAAADLAEPFGVWDFSDVIQFLAYFGE